MTSQPADTSHSRARAQRERLRREDALDETIEQSFPASDPPSTDPNPDSHTDRHIMNIQHYKQRLLDLENTLSAQIGQ